MLPSTTSTRPRSASVASMDVRLSITARGATTRDIFPVLGAGNTVRCRVMALSYAMAALYTMAIRG
ncbi:MAG: hypothetical protein SVT56_01680 [Chloroflexota bacterium]|nr:hypothetical protein [Chloroflexota bacterium]